MRARSAAVQPRIQAKRMNLPKMLRRKQSSHNAKHVTSSSIVVPGEFRTFCGHLLERAAWQRSSIHPVTVTQNLTVSQPTVRPNIHPVRLESI
jgi:hypothetical protein